AGFIVWRRQPKPRPDRLGVPEAGRHVDGSAIGQRHHRADTRHRHQAPAHLIVPHDGPQATMKNADQAIYAVHRDTMSQIASRKSRALYRCFGAWRKSLL